MQEQCGMPASENNIIHANFCVMSEEIEHEEKHAVYGSGRPVNHDVPSHHILNLDTYNLNDISH